VMVKDEDFGVIPGGKKPSLWKPGAEKLCLTFRLSPSFTSVETYDGDHLTIKSTCTLTHIPTGRVMGGGEAICSTKEKKYRQRKDPGSGKIVPNADLTDLWNTMIKMGNKRALIAAVLVVTAASSMFTQDMGEDVEKKDEEDEKKKDAKAVETTATVKDARPKPEPIVIPVKESGTWKGGVDHVKTLELPGGKPAWEICCNDGSTFKTADAAFGELVDGIDFTKDHEIKYETNKKGTLVLIEMREVKGE
jgi:hypothetical protein